METHVHTSEVHCSQALKGKGVESGNPDLGLLGEAFAIASTEAGFSSLVSM